jgi:hypothetical protein
MVHYVPDFYISLTVFHNKTPHHKGVKFLKFQRVLRFALQILMADSSKGLIHGQKQRLAPISHERFKGLEKYIEMQ